MCRRILVDEAANGPNAVPEVFAQMRAASDENLLVGLDAMFNELWGKLVVARLPGVPKPHPRCDKPIGNKVITCRAGTG
jgi:hypothetical protein